MTIYALFPLIATLVYIPLLVSTLSSRMWQKQHRQFVLFLILAMTYSLADYLFRSNFFPQYSIYLFQAILIVFAVMAVQFHVFTSSFFAPGKNRWLPFAYGSLTVTVSTILLGLVPEAIDFQGENVYPVYGWSMAVMVVPLCILLVHNLYVFWNQLKGLDNAEQNNQIVSLMLGLSTLGIFSLAALLPLGRQYPITHIGIIINTFILSYATLRHRLVDIRIVLRRGSAVFSLAVIGVAIFWLVLAFLHILFGLSIDVKLDSIATLAAALAFLLVYRLGGTLFLFIGRLFQGGSFQLRPDKPGKRLFLL